MNPETITAGDWILIQRQDYLKLHKLRENSVIRLGTLSVQLNSIVGHRYYDSFRMQITDTPKTFSLSKVNHQQIHAESSVSIPHSGSDNRHINDNGDSQSLTKTDIETLRAATSSADVLDQLISHSKTFAHKTQFSQAKYVRKKQRKYYDFITIRRPTIRLLTEESKVLRIDDLALLLSLANIQADGAYAVYDSGSNGLLPAAILDRVGHANDGRVIYMHAGNQCQRNALQAMRFPDEQYARCICVNSYSVLRWLHQNLSTEGAYQPSGESLTTEICSEKKKRKLCETDHDNAKRFKRPQWHYQNETACVMLREGLDGIILAAKEHPVSIAKELLPWLKPSRNFVAFHTLREPLQELYIEMVHRSDMTNVRLSSNLMRVYQVLPERTHPMVNMTAGGFILTATKLRIEK